MRISRRQQRCIERNVLRLDLRNRYATAKELQRVERHAHRLRRRQMLATLLVNHVDATRLERETQIRCEADNRRANLGPIARSDGRLRAACATVKAVHRTYRFPP